MPSKEKMALDKEILAGFIGSENLYRHSLSFLKYTEGVQYLSPWQEERIG